MINFFLNTNPKLNEKTKGDLLLSENFVDRFRNKKEEITITDIIFIKELSNGNIDIKETFNIWKSALHYNAIKD